MRDEEFDLYLKGLDIMSCMEMIERLNRGEIIICRKCGKGKYVAPEGVTGSCHSFNCDNCNDFLHITPGFTVE